MITYIFCILSFLFMNIPCIYLLVTTHVFKITCLNWFWDYAQLISLAWTRILARYQPIKLQFPPWICGLLTKEYQSRAFKLLNAKLIFWALKWGAICVYVKMQVQLGIEAIKIRFTSKLWLLVWQLKIGHSLALLELDHKIQLSKHKKREEILNRWVRWQALNIARILFFCQLDDLIV